MVEIDGSFDREGLSDTGLGHAARQRGDFFVHCHDNFAAFIGKA